MKFSTTYSSLAVAGLAAGAAVQNNALRHQKRALQVVTVTDVVWDVVTVTEYDQVVATTVAAAAVTSSAVATTSAAANAGNVYTYNAPAQSSSSSSSVAIAVVAAPAQSTSSTSTYKAPVATTTSSVAAAGNVAAAPTTSTSTSAAAATTASSASSGTYSGDATYYELGLTACGQTYTDNDYVAAISYILFDQNGTANPNNNPHCGQKIRVFRSGKSVDVTIVDRCAGCESVYNVDLSPIAFQVLATEAEGRVPITWSYI